MQQETPTQLEAEIASTDANTSSQEAGSPVNFSPIYLSALGAALLAACGGNDDGSMANATATTTTKSDTAHAASQANVVGADAVNGYSPPNSTTNNGVSAAAGFNNFPIAYTSNDAARFLLQSQLNASDAEISAVTGTTFASYLQQQFAKPIGQTGTAWLNSRGYAGQDKNNFVYAMYPADFMIWNQLFTSTDGMRKRMALGLSEFFVSSMQAADFDWRSYAYAQYWDTLVANAFGNYRQLLEAITLNPAMGYFLNTKGNQKENVKSGRVPDENYGREVMQLFTIGLYVLNIDGTEKLDGNGKKIETYTQSDVSNIARAFTGYDFDNTGGTATNVYNQDNTLATYTASSIVYTTRPMKLNASLHSTLAATFLGTTIPAGTAGGPALKIALDTLFNHPNVGPFFGKQMIQRFVTSNPSPDYVARVATAFNNNGAGVRGDLKAVWTAIFLDDEARRTYTVQTGAAPASTGGIQNAKGLLNRDISDKGFGKLREPMLRLVQWGRSFGLNSIESSWKLYDTTNTATQLGQSPLRSPSVFNFFRPGFVPPGTALAATGSAAPEFQLVNETTVGGYLNFMQSAIRTGFYTYDPKLSYTPYTNYVLDMVPSYAQELALSTSETTLVTRLNLILCAGQISATSQALMVTALKSMPPTATVPPAPPAIPTTTQKLDRIAAAVLMIMASPEYLIQK